MRILTGNLKLFSRVIKAISFCMKIKCVFSLDLPPPPPQVYTYVKGCIAWEPNHFGYL